MNILQNQFYYIKFEEKEIKYLYSLFKNLSSKIIKFKFNYELKK